MAWQDYIRRKALQFFTAGGQQVQWPTAYPNSVQAQIFWPNWPDQRGAISLTERRNVTQSSLMMAPINWLGTVLTEPPPQVMQLQPDDTYVPIADHPLLDLLSRPNAYMTGELLIQDFAYKWIVYGNVYWYKARNKVTGQVQELWPLDSGNVKVYTIQGGEDFISYYTYVNPGGVEEQILPQDIIHFRHALDPADPRLGLAPIDSLWLEILADEGLTKYTRALTENFGVPPYCISPEPDPTGMYQLKPEVMKREVLEGTTGNNAGKVLTFERPVKITMMGLSPDALAVDKARRIPEERVAAVLGIPGAVLGYGSHLDRATYSNIETAERLAWEQCVVPTLNIIASVLREQALIDFIGPNESLDDYWVEFELSEITALRDNENDLYKRTVDAYRYGVLKRSEARADLDKQSDTEDEMFSPQAEGHAAPVAFGSLKGADKKALGNVEPGQHDLDQLDAWFEKVAPDDATGVLDAKAHK